MITGTLTKQTCFQRWHDDLTAPSQVGAVHSKDVCYSHAELPESVQVKKQILHQFGLPQMFDMVQTLADASHS